jgi:hypothetical protein
MAQVFDTSNPEKPRARSELRVPADADGSILVRKTVVVDNFLSGSVPDRIEFVLDERFRERSLKSLLDQSELGSVGVPERDLANFIPVDLAATSPSYITGLMKHRLYRRDAVEKLIDIEFREFV